MLAPSRKSTVTRSHHGKAEDAHDPSSPGSEDDRKDEEMKKALDRMNSILAHYKYLVGEQERKLKELKRQISPPQQEDKRPETKVSLQVSENHQHKDPYTRWTGQLGKDSPPPGPLKDSRQLNNTRSAFQEEVQELKRTREFFQTQLVARNTWMEYLKWTQMASGKPELLLEMASARESQQITEIKQELTTVKSQLKAQSLEITKVQELFKTEALAKSVSVLAPQVTGVEGRLLTLLQEIEELKTENRTLREQRNEMKKKLDFSGRTIALLQHEKNKLQMNMTDSQKEQEDLLVLLNEQRHKIVALKKKLKDCGHPDEEEDDLLIDDDEDEEMEDVGMNLYQI